MSILALLWGVGAAGGCNCTRGAGVVEHREFPLRDFDALVVNGGPDVEVTVGSDFSVVGDVDANYWPLLEITTVGRTLQIDRDDGGLVNMAHSEIRITMPELRSLDLGEAMTDVSVEGLIGGDLEVEVGSHGDVQLTGRLDRLRVRAAGSVDATSVTMASAEVITKGADVRLGVVIDQLEASGSGTLVYAGTPAKTVVDPAIEVRHVGDPAGH
jgi:hypothetical protein